MASGNNSCLLPRILSVALMCGRRKCYTEKTDDLVMCRARRDLNSRHLDRERTMAANGGDKSAGWALSVATDGRNKVVH
jgi:hypothetical protein